MPIKHLVNEFRDFRVTNKKTHEYDSNSIYVILTLAGGSYTNPVTRMEELTPTMAGKILCRAADSHCGDKFPKLEKVLFKELI